MSDEKDCKRFGDEWYDKIVVKKSNTLSDMIESLCNEITSSDIEERINSLDKILSVIKKFDKTYLTESEVGLLLEFFISKINDFALEQSRAVEGTHYILHTFDNIPKNCEKEIFQCIFKDADVQSWKQDDRSYLFDIFYFIMKTEENIKNLKMMESDVVLAFITASQGEKDPRILMKVFKLFLHIVENFSLNRFVEEMFDIVCCYYPVDYTPPENDTIKISKEMLTSSCEKCLISTKAFVPYFHSFLQDRLTESDEDNPIEGKLYDCIFLKKALTSFGIPASVSYLKDYFYIFRSIILNPTLKKCQNCIPIELRDVTHYIIEGLMKEKERGEKVINIITNELLENVEPFIVQAEMGLCARAIDFVFSIFEITKDDKIKNKVIYWIGILLEGKTLQHKDNHKEIINDSLPFIGKFLSLSSTFGIEIDTLYQQLKNLEKEYGEAIFEEECGIEEILLKKCCEKNYIIFFNHGIKNIIEKEYDNKHKFFNMCHEISKKYPDFIINELLKCEKKFITNCNVFSLYISCLSSENIWRQFESFIIMNIEVNGFNEKISNIIIYWSKILDENILVKFLECILNQYDVLAKRNNVHHSKVIAEIGACLSENKHDFITDIFFKKLENDIINIKDFKNLLYIIFPLLIQSKKLSIEHIEKLISTSITEKEKIYLYGAYISHSSDTKSLYLFPKDMIQNIDARIYLTKILSIKNHPEYLNYINNIFIDINKGIINESDSEKIENLFNFEGLYNDPRLCNYTKTILWRQRYFCKFVEIFMEYYLFAETFSLYFTLLQPMLSFATTIPIKMNNELLHLLPVIVDALVQVNVIKTETDQHALMSLLNGLNQLLPMAPFKDVPQKSLDNIIIKLLDFIQDTSIPAISLQSLIVLETLTKVAPPNRISIFYNKVINALAVASKCSKRAIRIAAAKVRNEWEVLI
uniref:MMS19 nucleotide excision repair protein n=1 Tax=Parastrongyloides trichosuri TaxID=131310 RepID=A0A0N4ZQQ7_PARTI